MSDDEFIALLKLYEALSDWDGWKREDVDSETINKMIDRESAKRGYRSWAHAHHYLTTK